MNSLYGNFRTKFFTEIWEEDSDFLSDWKDSGLYTNGLISDTSVQTLYYLLYAKYGNSYIASSDQNQFKYKVFATIYQYGPAWEKRLAIQATLRGLSESDLLQGSKAIFNHAFNPSSAPSTSSLTELSYINDQNTTNYKRSKLEAYSQLWEMIELDVTEEFLNRFKKLFLTIVSPDYPLWYVSDSEENNDEEEE